MGGYGRILVALVILLSGLALAPHAGLYAGQVQWQRFSGGYQDGVTVTRARFEKGNLEVRALSSSGGLATLSVYQTSSNQLIGNLVWDGGEHRAQFNLGSNPQVITVRSSLGGESTVLVQSGTGIPPTVTPGNPTSTATGVPPTHTPAATPTRPPKGTPATTSTSVPPTSTSVPATATGVPPTNTPAATATVQVDTVSIQRAEYRSGNRELRIEATSSSSNAVMRAYVTSTNQLIGTLSNRGDGRYEGRFTWPSNPQNITVRSSLGGSASRNVTLK